MSLALTNLVIIPTYNEVENIEAIINAVLDQGDEFSILIVDDNSPDGTASKVKSHDLFLKRIFILERSAKLGLGSAYIEGFKYALSKRFDLIYEMDADFSHNPNTLKDLKQACIDGADIAVGSRYTKGGGIHNWTYERLALSFCASLYVRMITGMPVKDPTAGFVCYKRLVLESIDLDKVKFIGYAFQIEMKYTAWQKGFIIKEVPILFEDRKAGTSKMNTSIVSEAIKGVINLRFRALKGEFRKNT